ncbi:hypothetical protein [Paenibacillus polymyxa]|nr:hypothetical protein [Paenibacillus polymyxa]MCC3261746.1 hypothetical protein [Paenibacillus polymyxa]MDN4086203.1 hypothetical protein [Paenibacillus polymyxa]MDN4088523.1 hypothetical protein [Paenibacillus polymyxa]MDN4107974.1 hypothetical protein [Paenibacillus polymyxa]
MKNIDYLERRNGNMLYKLYPPFLVVPEEQDFSDAWESFCFKILSLEKSKNNLHRRNPPEQGVDLYDTTDKIAYQCKSVESGKSGDFNVTQAVNSLKSALAIKDELGWNTYILCSNVNVSGSAENKLKEIFPDIIIKSQNNWESMCEKYSDKVERNFNRLVKIPSERVVASIKEEIYDSYSADLINKIEKESYDIFLFTNRYDTIYKVPVSPDFSIGQLLNILRIFFKLPESKQISSEGISVSLNHSIMFNKKKQPLSKSLKEVGIKDGEVVTYWTKIIWKDNFELRTDVMYNMTFEMTQKMFNKEERARKAIEIFQSEIIKCFKKFNKQYIK